MRNTEKEIINIFVLFNLKKNVVLIEIIINQLFNNGCVLLKTIQVWNRMKVIGG